MFSATSIIENGEREGRKIENFSYPPIKYYLAVQTNLLIK